MTDSHQCPLNLDLLSVTNSDSSMDIIDIQHKPTSKGSSSTILSTQLQKLIFQMMMKTRYMNRIQVKVN